MTGHADEFYKSTIKVKFTQMQEHFLAGLKKGSYILAFKKHMKDILEYRTMEYYRRRYVGK